MNRTQIYLDEGQVARVDARAAAERMSRSAIIRQSHPGITGLPRQDAAIELA